MNRTVTRTAARGIAAATVAGIALLTMGGTALAAVPAATTIEAAQQQEILARHNAARDEVGVAHLSWNDQLAADAQAWADHLGNDLGGELVHEGRAGQGENLHWSSDPAELSADAVDGWVAERPHYAAAANKTDYDSTTNPEARTFGHWTQVVWSSTTEVGCGSARGDFGTVTACRYAPPGNYQGRLPYAGADQGGTGTPEKPTPEKPTPEKPTPEKPTGTTNEAACAYDPDGTGGYGSYVDGLALDVRDWEADMSDAINAYRREHGVPELSYSRTLARPAMWTSLDDYARGHGPTDGEHLDSRGMNVVDRVQYCSGYTGSIYELAYESSSVESSKWQVALEFWIANSGDALLDPSYTTFSGVQMAYGGNDVDRNPAYYTLLLGDH